MIMNWSNLKLLNYRVRFVFNEYENIGYEKKKSRWYEFLDVLI